MATKTTAKRAPKKTPKKQPNVLTYTFEATAPFKLSDFATAYEPKDLFLVYRHGENHGPLTETELRELIKEYALSSSDFEDPECNNPDYTVIRGRALKVHFDLRLL